MTNRDVLIAKINSIQNYLHRIHETVCGNVDRIDLLDVQDIDTSQFTAKCAKKKIKIMIKIEIKKFFLQLP